MNGNALPEDYEEILKKERLKATLKKEIKCVCVVGAEPGLHTPIDLMFE